MASLRLESFSIPNCLLLDMVRHGLEEFLRERHTYCVVTSCATQPQISKYRSNILSQASVIVWILKERKKVTKKLYWCSPSALQKNCHQSSLWLVSLPLTQMSPAGDCASSRVLPSYTFASGLSPSSWPLASWRVGPLDLCHPFYLSLGLNKVTHQTCVSFETHIFGGCKSFETYDRTL